MSEPPKALFRRWVHIREEDRAGVRVYRPADRPLPPARGRDGIEFRPDGSVLAYLPGPTDAPRPSAGRWRADEQATGRLRLSYPDQRADGAYEIVTVTEDELLLRQLPD